MKTLFYHKQERVDLFRHSRGFILCSFLFCFTSDKLLTSADPVKNVTEKPLWKYGNEPILPLEESALMTLNLYDDLIINNDDDSQNERTTRLSLKSQCRPQQIHLSVGKLPWEDMTISFMIPYECPLKDVFILLFYGVDPKNLVDSARIEPEIQMQRYNYSCEDFEYYQSGFFFHVPLTGLQHEQEYFYQVTVLKQHDSLDDRDVSKQFMKSKFSDMFRSMYSTGKLYRSTSSLKHLRSELTQLDHRFLTSVESKNVISANGRKEIGDIFELDDQSLTVIATSALLSFQTSQAPNKQKGTKMAIVADLGQAYNSTVTMYHMYKHTQQRFHNEPTADQQNKHQTTEAYSSSTPASIIICSGDMSYSDTNQKRWDSWFDLIEPLISKIPIQVGVGNHEMECNLETHSLFIPYQTRFFMPQTRPAEMKVNQKPCDNQGSYTDTQFSYEYGNSYYAFTHGLTRVIVLNSYGFIDVDSDQYQWLVQELNDTKAKRMYETPWILVSVHVPLYNTFSAHQNEETAIHMLNIIEPLFVEHRVNLVMSGHAHGYSRSKGVAYGLVKATAPIYITVGEGGNREGHSRSYNNDMPEDWIAKRDITEFGFGTMEFLNATHAEWKWIRNENVTTSHFTDETIIENQFFL